MPPRFASTDANKNEEQSRGTGGGMMSAIVVAAIGPGAFALGYIVYSRFRFTGYRLTSLGHCVRLTDRR
jgi:hypothetical protein